MSFPLTEGDRGREHFNLGFEILDFGLKIKSKIKSGTQKTQI